MTIKTRFTSSRIVLLSLIVSLFSATAQSDPLNTIYLTPPAETSLQKQGSPGSNLLSGNEPSTGLLTLLANRLRGLNGTMSTDSVTNDRLLAPVTGLINGLLGAPPR